MIRLLLFLTLISCNVFSATEEDTECKERTSVKERTPVKETLFIGRTQDFTPYYFQARSLDKDSLKELCEYCEAEKNSFRKYQLETLPGLCFKAKKKQTPILTRCLSVLRDLEDSAKLWCHSYGYNTCTNDKWIISAINKEDNSPLMRVLVVSNTESDYTHHIGICQSYARFMDSSPDKPKALSIKLHGFAAAFMLKRRPSRSLMLTAPTEFMTYMLKREFPWNSFNVRYVEDRGRNLHYLRINGELILIEGGNCWLRALQIQLPPRLSIALFAMEDALEDLLVSIDSANKKPA